MVLLVKLNDVGTKRMVMEEKEIYSMFSSVSFVVCLNFESFKLSERTELSIRQGLL